MNTRRLILLHLTEGADSLQGIAAGIDKPRDAVRSELERMKAEGMVAWTMIRGPRNSTGAANKLRMWRKAA